MSRAGRILRVEPEAGIPGGEIVIECAEFETRPLGACRVWLEGESARLVGLNARRALAILPEGLTGGELEVNLENRLGRTDAAKVVVGRKLAEDLHPVANPAFDPDDGALFVTRSGSRGQSLPVSIFRINAAGELADFSGDIMNPTGIAFDRSGQMFVTSRMDGNVYRVTPFKEAVPFARNLGVATGLAFDPQGQMYVGDRTGGTIYRINGIGEETA